MAWIQLPKMTKNMRLLTVKLLKECDIARQELCKEEPTGIKILVSIHTREGIQVHFTGSKTKVKRNNSFGFNNLLFLEKHSDPSNTSQP